MNPGVSIVIPTVDNKQTLLECLSSVKALRYPKHDLEVIVWDNGSKDGTLEAVREYFAKHYQDGWRALKAYGSERNTGASQGRNNAFRMISPQSKYIMCLDDDVVVSPESLAILVEDMDQDPGAGIVGARIVYYDAPDKTASGAGFINWWVGKLSERDTHMLTECDYVITCGCLIRKEVLERIGGFDPDYFVYHEDVDFCVRAQRNGFKVLYEPRAIVKHKLARGKRRTNQALYYLFRNKLLLIKKNAPFLQRRISLCLYGTLWLLKVILDSIIFHRGVDWAEISIILKAVLDGLMNRTGNL